MNIDIKAGEHATVVEISGSVDSLTAEQLSGTLSAQVAQQRVRLVGDFGGVEYTSSAGLRALLVTLKEVRRRGGDLRLAAVRPGVLRVLELSGFTGILRLFPDVEAAVASFASAPAADTAASAAEA